MSSQHLRRAGVGSVAAAAVLALLILLNYGPAYAAEAPVNLATAADFSVLAGTTVTNTGPSRLAQSLGVQPGSAATGFPPGIVAGEIHLADGVALQAQSDLTAAYVNAAGRTPFTSLAAQLGGRTLIPGVYRIGAAQLTGQLTLDSQNDPAAVFIFQVSSTLITASNSEVVFINGASPCNVFWQVSSSATLGTNSDFAGNILALTSIGLNTGATLTGRALARNGAVTLDDNVITEPLCAAASSPPASSSAAVPTSPGATTTPPSPGATTANPGATTANPGATTANPGATTANPGGTPASPNATNSGGPPVFGPITPPDLGLPGAPGSLPPLTPTPSPPIPGGPRLPVTGPGTVPALSVSGIMLILLGAGLMVRFRRPKIGP